MDVGFGISYGVKVGPDSCSRCGFIEAGPDPTDKPLSHYIDCWKRGVDPHPPCPEMVRATLKPEYATWIRDHVEGDGYGKCRQVSGMMALVFPELKRVYGTYYCWIWGPRNHFWLVTAENHVVDPTAMQFPSRGCGTYVMNREYPVELDDTVNFGLVMRKPLEYAAGNGNASGPTVQSGNQERSGEASG